MVLNAQLFCQQIDKKNAKKIWTAKHVFFTGVAIKKAVSVNWYPCATNGLHLQRCSQRSCLRFSTCF